MAQSPDAPGIGADVSLRAQLRVSSGSSTFLGSLGKPSPCSLELELTPTTAKATAGAGGSGKAPLPVLQTHPTSE